MKGFTSNRNKTLFPLNPEEKTTGKYPLGVQSLHLHRPSIPNLYRPKNEYFCDFLMKGFTSNRNKTLFPLNPEEKKYKLVPHYNLFATF